MEQQLDHLAFKFFKLFAQYESSLKERGFFQSENRDKIRVDWDRFANQEIGRSFLEQLGDQADSAEYILDKPPKKLTVNEEGKIIWQKVPNNEKTVQILFSHLRRIRNNLFHGSKFNHTWFDPERSKPLLEHGLKILEFFKSKALTVQHTK
jgi:hypothetical protein